jgi:hypothetical protein
MSAKDRRPTERDSPILEWLALWRGVTSPQIVRAPERRYGKTIPLKSVERRVRAPRGLGALDSAAILADWPTVLLGVLGPTGPTGPTSPAC